MPLKKTDKSKSKSSQEKIIKKKSSPVDKSKDTPTKKKIVKKSTTPDTKKKAKTKVTSKKSEINSDKKTVKSKSVKISSARPKTAKKSDLQRKKQIRKNIQEDAILPVSEDVKQVQEPNKTVENDILQNENSVKEKKPSSIIEANKKEQKVQQGEIKAKQKESKKAEQSKQEVVENKYKAVISINEFITVRHLADKMKLKVGDVLKKLLSMGSLATINQRLDTDVAIILANEFGYDAKIDSIYSEEKIIKPKEEDPLKLKVRPPVVTIMGHVDHGKTSLLDAIRDTDVVSGEHGGITQHIGAYKVKTTGGQDIAFLDTPGHEAFAAMRSRGAQVTDIVVLVVSADNGVMPQTVEAINHAKAANVPIIVAVNKIDLPASDPQKIRQELSNYDLIPEEWGGDTIMIDISAKQKKNINSLLEMILIKSEMMDLKANPDKDAEGVVIEARLDSRKGIVVTLLVQSGTLKVGDNVVVGTTYGKIRAISDEYGKRLNLATPSTPVEVLGINNEVPQSGDKFVVVGHESQAREIAQSRRIKVKEASLKPRHHLSLEDVNVGQVKDLRIILKADVQGSLGALSDALERLSTPEINLKIIHRGAGSITESDVALAVASDALIVGFNLRPDATVEKLAESEGISINVYRIIYHLIADIKAAMEGLLAPDIKEKILGKAVVKQVFKLSTYGTIAGCSVIDGKIQRGANVRLLRDNIIVFEGNISSLKRFKDDVKEIEKGYECGISLENYSDVKVGDVIENFTTEKVSRKLSN